MTNRRIKWRISSSKKNDKTYSVLKCSKIIQISEGNQNTRHQSDEAAFEHQRLYPEVVQEKGRQIPREKDDTKNFPQTHPGGNYGWGADVQQEGRDHAADQYQGVEVLSVRRIKLGLGIRPPLRVNVLLFNQTTYTST